MGNADAINLSRILSFIGIFIMLATRVFPLLKIVRFGRAQDANDVVVSMQRI